MEAKEFGDCSGCAAYCVADCGYPACNAADKVTYQVFAPLQRRVDKIAYRTADDTNGDGVYNGGKDRNDLWLVHPDGSGAHAIIANSYNIASIAWSPDSQSIVFVTQENRMLICDLQGQIISDFGETYLHADWAP